MKTLSQIRAANALKTVNDLEATKDSIKGKKGGDVVGGYPMLIVNNGLLATAALAVECKKDRTPKSPADDKVLRGILEHLTHPGIGILPSKAKEPKEFIKFLTNEGDAGLLRRATAEALEYLAYLKRFAP